MTRLSQITLLAIGSTLLLASCSSVNFINLPDGRAGFLVQCGGTMNSWGTCIKRVSEICGTDGYEIVSQTEEEGIANIMGSITPVITRDMVAVCNAPKDKMVVM